jgi:hypothetical protein
LFVLSRVASDFRPPNPSEGYDRIFFIKSSDRPSPIYTRDDISSILHDIRESSLSTYSLTYSPIAMTGSHAFHGGSIHGGNGHGRANRGVRPYPHRDSNNWREGNGSSAVRGATSGFIHSKRGRGKATELSHWRNANASLARMATPGNIDSSEQERPLQIPDRRESGSADDTVTIA